LARQLGCSADASIVFEGTISVSGLADGPYVLDLLQLTSRTMVVKADVLTVTVQSPTAFMTSAPAQWEEGTPGDEFARLATAMPKLVVRDQNLPSVGI
jgi:hypothetical protein